jgi:hypothetical protein
MIFIRNIKVYKSVYIYDVKDSNTIAAVTIPGVSVIACTVIFRPCQGPAFIAGGRKIHTAGIGIAWIIIAFVDG